MAISQRETSTRSAAAWDEVFPASRGAKMSPARTPPAIPSHPAGVRSLASRFALMAIAALGLWCCQGRAAQPKVERQADALRVSSPYLNLRVSLSQPTLLSLSPDSLGLEKNLENPLRAQPVPVSPFVAKYETGDAVKIEFRRSGSAARAAGWQFEISERRVRLVSQWSETEKPEPLVLEFEPRRCHVTLLGASDADGSVRLPAVMHFPDQGSFRISAGDREVSLGYDATRAGTPWVKITFPAASATRPSVDYSWEVAAIHPQVQGVDDDPRFRGFRRNWLNILQWNPRLRVLANHAASDTCAFCLYEYADIALHTPPLADRLSALDLIRNSLDRYLEGMPGYGLPGYVGFDIGGPPSQDPPYIDSYPSLLIAAADYVDGSGDAGWLARQYGGLRAWTDKMLAMDRDGNGLLEYPYSGNSGSWSGRADKRPSNWWDCIGFGHEDAYGNALAYRALRGIGKLAERHGQSADAVRYAAAAEKLRAVFWNSFHNPTTGVLAGWRSADGQLHDYYFPWISGAAIHYGLVPRDQAGQVLDRMLAKMNEVGYSRFDLGLPGNLIAVPRKDYVHLDRRWGGGENEDNSDGFQKYENGGATASFAFFTLAALYDLERREDADRMLFPLLEAFEKGAFQGQNANGMSNDWKAWDGSPWGYEGFLVDNYYALLAVLTRSGADRTASPAWGGKR